MSLSFIHAVYASRSYTFMLSSNIQTKLAATVPAKRLVFIVAAYDHRNCLLLPAERRKTEVVEGGGRRCCCYYHFQTAASDIITERTFSVVLHNTTCYADAHIL